MRLRIGGRRFGSDDRDLWFGWCVLVVELFVW